MQEENSYICGVSIFSEEHKFFKTIVVKLSLSCESPMKAAYYSVKAIVFPEICFHRGVQSGGKLCNNEVVKKLKENFSKVRPICLPCMKSGKEPVIWSTKNNLKASAKKEENQLTFRW